MPRGTYTILIEIRASDTLSVGSLGSIQFDAGWYAYTGSAVGPGGFTRIDRHRELATGGRDTRHWHIDYLLGHATARLETVIRTPHAAIECEVAQAIHGETINGFGASDCQCASHLTYRPSESPLEASVRIAHLEAT